MLYSIATTVLLLAFSLNGEYAKWSATRVDLACSYGYLFYVRTHVGEL